MQYYKYSRFFCTGSLIYTIQYKYRNVCSVEKKDKESWEGQCWEDNENTQSLAFHFVVWYFIKEHYFPVGSIDWDHLGKRASASDHCFSFSSSVVYLIMSGQDTSTHIVIFQLQVDENNLHVISCLLALK